jgi:hypothetical protein
VLVEKVEMLKKDEEKLINKTELNLLVKLATGRMGSLARRQKLYI